MTGKIFVVDRQPLIRLAYLQIFAVHFPTSVFLHSDNATSAIHLIHAKRPDLVICDVSEVGLAFLQESRDLSQASKVVVVTAAQPSGILSVCRQAGVMGFVSKFSPPTEIISAAKGVISGEEFLCNKTKEMMSRSTEADSVLDPSTALSPRELDIFRMVGVGLSTEEIADSVEISKRTVDTHRQRIRSKLHLRSSRCLVIAAARWVAQSDITTGSVTAR